MATGRQLERLVQIILRQRRWVLVGTAAVLLLSGLSIPGINVSTSRHALVSADDPYQARLLDHYREFGYPEAFTFVLHGGTAAARRAAADALASALESDAMYDGQVFYRLRIADAAPLLLLHEPTLAQVLITGLNETHGIAALAAGIAHDLGSGAALGADSARQLSELAALAQALDNHLRAAGKVVMGPNDLFGGAVPRRGPWAFDEAGYLAGPEGEHHLVTMLPSLPSDEIEVVRPYVQRARALRDAVLAAHPEVQAPLTGVLALAVDEQDVITRGVAESSVGSGVAIFVLLFLAFRRTRLTLLALAPLLVGTVTTLGIVRWTFGELNLVTANFVSVLMGLGIDFAVHFIARVREIRREGRDFASAVVNAALTTGPAVVVGAVTTAVAFLTTVSTAFTAFAQLGVITAFGMLLTLGGTILLLPVLLGFAGDVLPRSPRDSGTPVLLHRVLTRAAWPILALGTLGAVLGALRVNNIWFDARYFDFVPRSVESAGGLHLLQNDDATSLVFANLAANDVEGARRAAERLRRLPTVAYVESPSDYLPPLEAPQRELFALLARHPQPNFAAWASTPPDVRALAAAAQRIGQYLTSLRITAQVMGGPVDAINQALPAVARLADTLRTLTPAQHERLAALQARMGTILQRSWRGAERVAQRGRYDLADFDAQLRARFAAKESSRVALYAYPTQALWTTDGARAFVEDVEAIDPRASGLAFNIHEHPRMIIDGFRRAALLAAVAIFLILLADLRRFSQAVLALVPVALGWCWMIGLLPLCGLPFTVANIVVLPLLLGIGIDSGIHVVHRVRESTAHGRVADMGEVLAGTGNAISLAAATTMAGFAALMIPGYGAMSSLGLTMVLGIACCLLASVLVLPALLIVLGKAR